MDSESLLSYFRTTFTSIDAQERKHAEHSIQQIEKELSSFEFITKLLELIFIHGQSVDNLIKLLTSKDDGNTILLVNLLINTTLDKVQTLKKTL